MYVHAKKNNFQMYTWENIIEKEEVGGVLSVCEEQKQRVQTGNGMLFLYITPLPHEHCKADFHTDITYSEQMWTHIHVHTYMYTFHQRSQSAG